MRNFFITLLVTLLLPAAALAAHMEAAEQLSLPSERTYEEDTYLSAGNLSIASTILGDLVAAGGEVLITGSVSEDALIAGGSITVIGDITDDIRAAGGSVTIAGDVNGDVVVAAGQTTIAGGMVGGDIIWAGGMLTVDAPVAGDATLIGGKVTINAPIAGNVEYTGDDITIGENGSVGGELIHKSMPGTGVGTTISEDLDGILMGVGILALILSLLMKFIGSWVLTLAVPKFATEIVERSASHTWAHIGRGFVALIVMPVAAVFIMVSVIGLPIGVFTLLAYVLMLMFAHFVMPIIVGVWVRKWVSKDAEPAINWLTVLFGVVALLVLGLIPIVGWIVRFGLFLLTVGVVVQLQLDELKRWR